MGKNTEVIAKVSEQSDDTKAILKKLEELQTEMLSLKNQINDVSVKADRMLMMAKAAMDKLPG